MLRRRLLGKSGRGACRFDSRGNQAGHYEICSPRITAAGARFPFSHGHFALDLPLGPQLRINEHHRKFPSSGLEPDKHFSYELPNYGDTPVITLLTTSAYRLGATGAALGFGPRLPGATLRPSRRLMASRNAAAPSGRPMSSPRRSAALRDVVRQAWNDDADDAGDAGHEPKLAAAKEKVNTGVSP